MTDVNPPEFAPADDVFAALESIPGINERQAPEPRIESRVRWTASAGTRFGEVMSVDKDARTLVVQIEGSTIVRTLRFDEVTVQSKPGQGDDHG